MRVSESGNIFSGPFAKPWWTRGSASLQNQDKSFFGLIGGPCFRVAVSDGSHARNSNTRIIIRNVLLLSLLCGPVVGVLSAAEESVSARDMARRSMAARSAAKRVIEEVKALSSEVGADKLLIADSIARSMLEDSEKHISREASRKLSEQIVRRERWDSFRAGLTNAVLAAQAQSPLELRSGDILKDVGDAWEKLVDEKIDCFIKDNYDGLFDSARERAVDLQKREVDKTIKMPLPAEIDSTLSGLKKKDKKSGERLDQKDFQKLSGWAGQFARSDIKFLFDENRNYVKGVGSKLVDGIKDQYDRQVDVIDGAVSNLLLSAAIIRADRTSADITAQIGAHVTAEKQKLSGSGGVPVCDAFSIVTEEAEVAAKRLEQDKFSSYVKSMTSIPVTTSEIERQISGDMKSHITIKQSMDVLFAAFRDKLYEYTAGSYVKSAKGGTDADRQYFTTLLRENAGLAGELRINADRLFEKTVTEVRSKISEEQYKKYFSALKTDQPLEEGVLVYAYDNRNCLPTRSIRQALDILKSGGNTSFSAIDESKIVFLEETERRVVDSVSGSVASGRDVLDSQLSMLREMEKGRLEDLQNDVAAGRSLDDVLAEWGDDLEGRWKKTADSSKCMYKKIFARTSDVLNKTVRQFYESVKQEQAAAVKSEQAKKTNVEFVKEDEKALKSGEQSENENEQSDSEGGSGGSSSAADAQASQMVVNMDVPIEEADCLLVLDNSRLFRCDAKLTTLEGEDMTSVRINPKKVEEAAQELYDGVKESVGKLLEKKKIASTPDERLLKIYVVIKSDDIRHKMNIILMQKVRQQVKDWSENNMPADKPVELVWSVGM